MNKVSFIFVLSCIALANAYSSGAPPGTCKNGLIPAGHEVEPQKSASPYSLKIDRDAYPVEIVISGQNDEEFKGFLIHAKKGAEGDFFGEFSIPVGVDAQFVACSEENPKAAVTHKDAGPKKSVTLQWYAPEGQDPKEAVFPFTVVQDKATFWVNN